MRVAICFGYSARPVQLKICVRKLKKTCGIKISEEDTRSARSTVMCRTCVTLKAKMDQFIRRAHSLDNMPSDLN